jgi:hypothetical protein
MAATQRIPQSIAVADRDALKKQAQPICEPLPAEQERPFSEIRQSNIAHPKGAGMSDRQIAEHVGVDHQTVANWRKQLSPSVEVRQMERTVTRNGTTYQQNVANIGKHRAAIAQLEERPTSEIPKSTQAADPLTWLESNVSRLTVLVQNVPRYGRGKNRVIVETSDGFGSVTVGAPSLRAALFRLRVRLELQQQAAAQAARGKA